MCVLRCWLSPNSSYVIFVEFGERITLRKIIKSRSGTKTPGESSFVRSIPGFDASYIGEFSPFTNNRSLKNRWLLTSTTAGLFGALIIGGVFFFTYGSNQIAVTNTDTDTRLTSRNPQKTMIGNKSDQTEVFVGDMPVLADKNVTSETKPGEQYTNVAVTFGRSEIKTNRLAKSDGLSVKPRVSGNVAEEVQSPEPAKAVEQTASASTVLGTINLGDKISSIIGLQSSKPTVLAKAPPTTNLNVSGSSPRKAASNITRVSKREPVNQPTNMPYKTVSISPGDTLVEILTDNGAFYDDAVKIVAALKPHFSPSSLKEGQKVTFALVPAIRDGAEVLIPNTLELATGSNKRLTIERNELGKYALLTHAPADNDADQHHAQAIIKKSLYLAARNQGIPDNIIVDMMRIHAYDVDFQREVRVGDTFEVFYGDENTLKRSKSGTVLFSSLTLSGNAKSYYRFKTTDDNIVDYYDINGRSAKKFLMRTPINGARLSSGYGMRRHPILRYTRMHRGVDFAAARGTPIKAAGNGVIEKKGGTRGYGNYIRIRHANGYKTAYGHMSRYAAGISVGKRVRQGQVIGYVGSTGRSTGNHLHYEVWVGGKPVDPMRVRVPTGRQLTGKMLALYKKQKVKIDSLRRTAPVATRVAAAREAQRDGIN